MRLSRYSIELLESIKKRPDLWYVVCNRDNSAMNKEDVISVINECLENELYEFIVILLTVHSDMGFVETVRNLFVIDVLIDSLKVGKVNELEEILKSHMSNEIKK